MRKLIYKCQNQNYKVKEKFFDTYQEIQDCDMYLDTLFNTSSSFVFDWDKIGQDLKDMVYRDLLKKKKFQGKKEYVILTSLEDQKITQAQFEMRQEATELIESASLRRLLKDSLFLYFCWPKLNSNQKHSIQMSLNSASPKDLKKIREKLSDNKLNESFNLALVFYDLMPVVRLKRSSARNLRSEDKIDYVNRPDQDQDIFCRLPHEVVNAFDHFSTLTSEANYKHKTKKTRRYQYFSSSHLFEEIR